MQSFELNKHGKIVFPANCFPDLDFSTFDSIEQLDAVIRRDFDSKAPPGPTSSSGSRPAATKASSS